MASQAFRSDHLFLLRIWREDMGNDKYEWRAYIQHVLSGEARYIRSWDEIELFLENLEGTNSPYPRIPKPPLERTR
jgi:hypothetical protein